MIIRSSEQVTEIRENMRGGTGKVTIRHYFSKDQVRARCRLCAQLVIPPEASIGMHQHSNEDEIYIIQEGVGVVVDDDKETVVRAGDAVLTGEGMSHSVKNTGNAPLIITAVIMQY